ncbi:MAG: zinc-binding dehydrogenase [Mycobacteriaceae bacterium]|nr:zinc-binding dehydrogenase [Mycobacteriaceae bacterium]
MHAIRQYEFGPAENLRYEEVPDLAPGAGQVRVAVAAAGVHLVDTSIRQGQTGGPFPLPALPMTPGREVAGVVDAVGAEVSAEWIGKRVVAHLGQASGGYAEQALAAAASLHELPAGVSAQAAVAAIGTGRTAMGILETAQLTADDVVVITAAAGGLGALLVQAARNVGAIVAGVAGGVTKVALVRELGADIAVDYTAPDWAEQVRTALAGRAATVALDGVGGESGRAALELLGSGGRLVLFGFSAGAPVELSAGDLFRFGISATAAVGARLLQRPGGLRELEIRALTEVASGRLTPLVNPPFSLKDAATAHTALTTRATVGKVVLTP